MASGFLYGLIVVIWLRLLLVIGLGVFDVYARRQRRQTADHRYSPADITFVVPAYNESRTLPMTLASIREDIDAGASLIIVDDGSVDDTFETASSAVKDLPNGQVLRHSENLGKPDALNTALKAVKTRFMLTVDADTRLCPGSTTAALAALHRAETEDKRPIAVAFDVAASPSNTFFFELQRIEYDAALNFERRAQGVLGAISVCPGAASLWQTEALRQINGFRGLTATEDVDATLRLAAMDLRTIHEPGARAITMLPATCRQLMAQRRRWCLGHYQNIWVNRPRSGAPLRYIALTYLNFAALSFFLPLMLLATLGVILFEPEMILRQTLWFTSVIWLASAYGQRLFALKTLGLKAKPISFLAEPFYTMIVHFVAAASAALFLIRTWIGRHDNIWSNRAR